MRVVRACVFASCAAACVITAALVVRQGPHADPGVGVPAAAAQQAKPASQPVEAAKAPTRAGSPEARSPAKATRIASAASAAPGGAGTGDTYSDNVDAQIGEIASIVERQLSAKKLVEPDQAEKAAAGFADSLRGVIKEPLSKRQFVDVTRSLEERYGFSWVSPYPDITDLEIEAAIRTWTRFIKWYLQRKPLTAAEAALLHSQLDGFLLAARSTMDSSLDASEMPKVPELVNSFERIVYPELRDPVMPVGKRPFSQAEMAELMPLVTDKMASEFRRWRSTGLGPPEVVVGGIANDLRGRIWQLQHLSPPLKPELMQRMRDERSARNEARSKWLQSLPWDERMRVRAEEEGRKLQVKRIEAWHPVRERVRQDRR